MTIYNIFGYCCVDALIRNKSVHFLADGLTDKGHTNGQTNDTQNVILYN